jgi:hypothetical protein
MKTRQFDHGSMDFASMYAKMSHPQIGGQDMQQCIVS